ncbi:hypothetical protein P153DRAFT_393811 [Dothidotthia symphoricarpi CBS 119687]|uniref:Cora-domain-containing protein n=1 Tax=Dothidotthia symphoricarpi CBS 119687 TaxID=1392245 RepID=A0A6A6ANU3_9PLEO|nr:uncharacterized protein P153DRAFT_393811 [Dothidotthia symphoricarpi CBS 119687]KAF2132863.1 hypothetical protein P153DRAFT_393811 [Dothidotthia symphoricarpi CBS 119687]
MAENIGSVELSSLSQIGTASATTNGKSSAPSPTAGSDNVVGSWLCADGEYQRYITALSSSNPSLAKPDPNNKKNPLRNGNALVVLLDAPATGPTRFEKTEFTQSLLRAHFEEASHNLKHDRRRIYLMEGLAPDYVSMVGGHFFMDPTFFQRHERTCVWSDKFTPVSDALPLPSSLEPDTSFHLQYCELREFNMRLETVPYFCNRTGRHVGLTAPRPDSTTGIVRRKVGWWSQETGNGGWDVVILCDPRIDRLRGNPRVKLEGESEPSLIIDPDNNLENGPFQGGYIDFLPTVTRDLANTGRPHPHDSMLRDLIYYFEKSSHLITEEAWKTPSSSALFLKKIVAAHYHQLVDYIKVMLPSLELKLTTAWIEEQDHWRYLQTISRRCGNYRDDIEDTLFSLGYSLEPPSKVRAGKWEDCERDFQYLYFRLKLLKERTDSLMQAMTGLASIAGNRQNLEEAKRVQRLTGLALFFVPLAYTSSLFSMQDNYAPNKGKFWVYWVSAIGVVLVTFILAMVADRALDDTARWSWKHVSDKHLPFWKGKGSPGKVKRKTTGIHGPARR